MSTNTEERIVHEGFDTCCSLDVEQREMWEVLDELRYSEALMRRGLAALDEADIADMDNNFGVQLTGEWWHQYKLPDSWLEGSSERFYVKRFDVKEWQGWLTDDQLQGRMCPPGTYIGIYEKGMWNPWMSDVPSEMIDHHTFKELACGDVLVTGLGLGWVTQQLLQKSCVNTVTVIEMEPEVVELVKPNFTEALESGRLRIIVGNALTYSFSRSVRFDFAWHDIWPTIDDRNEFDEMREQYFLNMRKPGSYSQFCWGENYFKCQKCGGDINGCYCCEQCGAPEGGCVCD